MCLIDLGNRFRLVANEVDVVEPPQPLRRLPVARAVWQCRPDLKTAAAAWIYAGGAHHSAYSDRLRCEHLEDFARIAGVEVVTIGAETTLGHITKELRWNEVYYHLASGIGR